MWKVNKKWVNNLCEHDTQVTARVIKYQVKHKNECGKQLRKNSENDSVFVKAYLLTFICH